MCPPSVWSCVCPGIVWEKCFKITEVFEMCPTSLSVVLNMMPNMDRGPLQKFPFYITIWHWGMQNLLQTIVGTGVFLVAMAMGDLAWVTLTKPVTYGLGWFVSWIYLVYQLWEIFIHFRYLMKRSTLYTGFLKQAHCFLSTFCCCNYHRP